MGESWNLHKQTAAVNLDATARLFLVVAHVNVYVKAGQSNAITETGLVADGREQVLLRVTTR